jgi:hypothetical protein
VAKKKYLLPSDRLSASEIKKLNGEITVYTMKEPISWAKFKGYPKDIQREYLQWFVDEFGATRGMIAEVFDMSSTGVYPYLKQQGLNDMLVRGVTDDNKKKFKEWIKQYRIAEEVEETPIQEEPKKEKVKVVEQPIFFHAITGCEMNLEGKASEISQTLFSLFRDQKIAVSVVFVGGKESEDEEVD